ncbi:MAG: response regulator transcription factor [Acidimicrobiia bacterium]|nr:response regulator transcription factor [Acidimicrobiia bacterium]MDH3396825.1 response regulator transcription factor [Acidimicrobiia bacterium]
MAAVLIIEDEQRIRETLARRLAERGYDVESAAAGLVGLELVIARPPDVVVLDLGLPDVDGREVLKMIRAVSAVPVIVATARDDETEIVRVLDAGADDYVVKPFSAEQLEARIRAVLRRGGGDDVGGTIEVGELSIYPQARVAQLSDRDLELTRKEFDLLLYLAERAGTVVGRRELLAEVWRQPYGGADKTVDVHLSWLRRKLGESAAKPVYLHTVRGVGVKLAAPTP